MTRLRVCTFVLSISALLPTATAATNPAPLTGSERILWIGNSYSGFFGHIMDVLNSMFEARPDPFTITWGDKGKGMGTLQEYWRGVETAAGTVDSIRHGGWDYVVVQGWEDAAWNLAYCAANGGDYSWANKEHAGYVDTFVTYGVLFAQEIRSAGATPLFFQPQASAWNFLTEKARGAVSWDSLERATDAYIVPTIMAWDSALAHFPTNNFRCASNAGANASNTDFIDIFYSDCGHQNGNGMLLNASVWYTVLTGGDSPVDLHPQYPGGMLSQFDPTKEQTIKQIGYRTGLHILASHDGATGASRATWYQAPERGTAGDGRRFTLDGRRIRGSAALPVVQVIRGAAGKTILSPPAPEAVRTF